MERWTGGDDWLTLNVFSPDPGGDAGLPVMVWIHGGGYAVGASAHARVRPLAGSPATASCWSTANHRVGVEGFAHLDGAPADKELLDQVAALEWVRDNIGAFGGDPGRVTVFGQSARAGSVAALAVMPRAAGLFRRAVAQSVPGTFFAPKALGRDIAERPRRRAGAAGERSGTVHRGARTGGACR